MVSETGGLPVEHVCMRARARTFPLAASTPIDRSRPERMSTLHNEAPQVVHDAIPRSRALRGMSPRIWGRRD